MPYIPREKYFSKDPLKRQKPLDNLQRGRKGRTKPKKAARKVSPWSWGYQEDIIRFAGEQFSIPETRKAIALEDWQKERILKPPFYTDPRPSLALLSTPKKNGKSATAGR